MNVRAEELGLTKTQFKNSTGLDISPSEAGAYGSARDIARLMDYIVTNAPDTVALTNLEVTTIENEEGAYHTAKNTNDVAGSIDGLIASKTGYTALAGGNLVVALNVGLNRPIVIVVLGSSYEGRFTDTEKLIERVRQYVGKSGT
jgi:D-alanyl-D-alanine carboxypeptidase (penicillin-binding protein 5/6)